MTIEVKDRGIKGLFTKTKSYQVGEPVNIPYKQILDDDSLIHGRDLLTELPNGRIRIESMIDFHPIEFMTVLRGDESLEVPAREIGKYDLGFRAGKKVVWKPSK